jgi:HAD superfamily hydrolase (TIGR01509 family)
MPPVRGVLLDLDGTIADSIDFFCAISIDLMNEAGLPAPPRAELRDAIASGVAPFERFLPAEFPDREKFVEHIVRTRWPVWFTRYEEETRPLPGACEAVRQLSQRGLSLAIVSSSMGTFPFLERWGIRDCFEVVLGRQDVSNIKPHPAPLLASLDRLRLRPEEVLNVGDTPLDVRAGRDAGVVTVGVLTGAGTSDQLRDSGAEAILRSLADFPDYLDRR